MSQSKKDKKRASILSAAVIIAILAVFVGLVLFPLVSEVGGMIFAVAILVIYALVILAVIFAIIAALKQRLEEIEGGEEEEAKKY